MKKTKEWNKLKHENLEEKRNEIYKIKVCWNEICLVFKGEQHLINEAIKLSTVFFRSFNCLWRVLSPCARTVFVQVLANHEIFLLVIVVGEVEWQLV